MLIILLELLTPMPFINDPNCNNEDKVHFDVPEKEPYEGKATQKTKTVPLGAWRQRSGENRLFRKETGFFGDKSTPRTSSRSEEWVEIKNVVCFGADSFRPLDPSLRFFSAARRLRTWRRTRRIWFSTLFLFHGMHRTWSYFLNTHKEIN